MSIYFYGTKDEYGCFSNFSLHGFALNGKYWPTVEHYFQAQKFAGTADEETIRLAPGPAKAKELGRQTRRPLRPDWERVKDDVMREAVLRKFETHPEIRQKLLATGDELLVENSPSDYYWGCGADGSGRNRLGQILGEVRVELRQRTEEQRSA